MPGMPENTTSPPDCSKSHSNYRPRDATVHVISTPWDHPHGVQLRQAQRLEITSLGGIDPGTPPTAGYVTVYVVAYDQGVPVGCGGLRPLLPKTGDLHNAAEIKRMFVERSHRGRIGSGQSVAAIILFALEEAALQMGLQMLKLETGEFLKQARAFYERHGFKECAAFGAYTNSTNSVFYEKSIAAYV
jgi:GNAT superfamily N-acetyltransferase